MSRFDDVTLSEGQEAPRRCPSCGAETEGESYCRNCGGELGDPRVGAVVAGRYRIDRLIAEGGMGRVYRATHLSLGEPCVVKFLITEHGRPELRGRFRREALLLSRLGHPNAVAVMDFGEDEGVPFLVMELVRGVPLSTLFGPSCERMPLERLGGIFAQLLKVLEAAHRMGIVHRDLKPDNVMLVDAGDRVDRVKLLDFGLAVVEGSPEAARLTQAGLIVGTPYYMSPEQCRGEETSPASDVYSLGVMFYEALTGSPPFVGENAASTIARHMYAPPPPLAPQGAWPASLERLVLRMLAKDPAVRPSAEAAHDELAAIVSGLDPETRATAERILRAGADRAARAIGSAGAAPSDEPGVAGARVLVCCRTQARFEELAMALGVHALVAVPWIGEASPAGRLEAGDLSAVLIKHDEGLGWDASVGVARGLPVLVFDVADTKQLAAAIRLGVNDAATDRTSDGEIGFRVKRALVAAARAKGTRSR